VGFVTPDDDAYELWYNQISNPLLWFIQHYLWNLSHNPSINEDTDRAWRDGYVAVNRMFADRAIQAAKRPTKNGARRIRPLILVQDYQLYLVPTMVREAIPDVTLQQFIHIPWPTPQYWKVLPDKMRDPIVEGLLGNDIVGFQTPRDCRNFLLTCEENLGLPVDYREQTVFYQGRTVWVRAYPVSIDVDHFLELAESKEVLQEQRNIHRWRPNKLIIRVDRSDPSKNLLRGFAAYDRMLQAHPDMIGEVQFWAYLQPSRQDVPFYRKYLDEVQFITRELNQRYGREGWKPVRLELREDLNRAIAAYKEFDVLMVNSIYDGMNLVAKEGIMVNQRDGVLILSENTGSFGELGEWAFGINPFDIDATAAALYSALTMDERQRRLRVNKIRASVRQNDIARWISSQLQDIRDLTRAGRSKRRSAARTLTRMVPTLR
jgi:trehalose 6-phosphate synthase